MKKLFLFLLLAVPAAAFAQDADGIHLIRQTSPQTGSFAAPLALEFELSHAPGFQVKLDKKTEPEGFLISQAQARADSPGTSTYFVTALPFTLGKSTFTAVTFNLTDTQGNVRASAQSEPFYINISPVHYFNDKELKEIRPPYIPADPLFWAGTVLLAAALAALVYWFIRRLHHRAKTVSAVQDNRPSDEIALSKIDALLNSGLWEQQQYKVFYITLADIFREYLWKRFGVDASADTSAELLRRVKNLPQMAPLLSPLKEFLSSGDLVKFAKMVPTEPQRNKDVTFLRGAVQATAPVREEKHD